MSQESIKKKLVANCSQCDSLCCSAFKFETPLYKKEPGVQCKNLDSQIHQCKIYNTRKNLGYEFCLKFDCHGAGQAVTKLFRTLGYKWENHKLIKKVQHDIFVSTYICLSRYFFPHKEIQLDLIQSTKKNVTPFVEKAIDTLGFEIGENLGQLINISRNRIKNKLKADCNQCDALCCNMPEFTTPTYKKTAGTICKNLDNQTLKCQIYSNRETLGYNFCLKFDCHGAGQAVTKLFQKLGRNWQNDKKVEKIQYNVFAHTYLYLSECYFPDQEPQVELDEDNKKDIQSFFEEAIYILGEELDEKL